MKFSYAQVFSKLSGALISFCVMLWVSQYRVRLENCLKPTCRFLQLPYWHFINLSLYVMLSSRCILALSGLICACVCVCVCRLVRVFVFVCLFVCVCVCVCVDWCVCVCVCMCVWIKVCVDVCTNVYACARVWPTDKLILFRYYTAVGLAVVSSL